MVISGGDRQHVHGAPLHPATDPIVLLMGMHEQNDYNWNMQNI